MRERVTGGGWDFFVSYAQTDRAWAEWIAWQLEADGYQVLIQAWDMVPGSNWIHLMQEGVRQASRTVAVLSAAYVESAFAATEWQATWREDPLGEQRKLLVFRVADCERPGLLAGVVSVDLFGVAEAAASTRIKSAVRGALTGRTKPSAEPAFPPLSPRGAGGAAVSRCAPEGVECAAACAHLRGASQAGRGASAAAAA